MLILMVTIIKSSNIREEQWFDYKVQVAHHPTGWFLAPLGSESCDWKEEKAFIAKASSFMFRQLLGNGSKPFGVRQEARMDEQGLYKVRLRESRRGVEVLAASSGA